MEELFLRDTLGAPKHTPDIVTLENYEYHFMLDVGPITRPMHALCSGYTQERMSLLIRQEDNLAVPIRMDGMHRARVYGALYKVSTEKLVELDKWKENGVLFMRKPIDILVPYPDQKRMRNAQLFPRKVWFYQANKAAWREPIEVDRMRYTPNFNMAKTYLNDEPLLNNHFRFANKTLEIHRDPPKQGTMTPEVAAHVQKKNAEAIYKPLWKQLFDVRDDPVLDYFKAKDVRRQLKEARIRRQHEAEERKGRIFYDLSPHE